jgi:hypothetical protein
VSDIESDRVPQHDPPADAELIQPEVDERRDSIVAEGDDADHVLPPLELDPYTPEPATPPHGRPAMLIALLIIVVILAIVIVYAIVK